MQLKRELLDYSKPWELPDVYLFTGNTVIKNNGAIVMGRGAARQVRDLYPGCDKAFGQFIHENPDTNIVLLLLKEHQLIGWFKVKEHWAEEAKLSLIQESVTSLTARALMTPDVKYHLNFPGVGNGKLTEEEVMPILESLPDNVIIYR